MQPDSLVNLAGNLTAVGFVVWLAHRLTTKIIPDMAAAFIAANERQRQDFRETLERQRQDFAEFHKRENLAHELRLQGVIERRLGTESGDHI